MLMESVREDDVLELMLSLLLLLLLLEDGGLRTLSGDVRERRCICWVAILDGLNDLFNVNAMEALGRVNKEIIVSKEVARSRPIMFCRVCVFRRVIIVVVSLLC